MGFQVYEFSHFAHLGLTPRTNIFGSTFFTMTGFHGGHVTFGVIWLVIFAVSRLADSFKQKMLIIGSVFSVKPSVLFVRLLFSIEINYIRYLINSGFTFILYPVFLFLFNILEKKIAIQIND